MKTNFFKSVVLMMLMSLITMSVYSQIYSNPHSVIFYEKYNSYFISNQSSNSILQLDVKGNLTSFSTTAIFTQPKGLAIADEILYVANNSNILGIDISTGDVVLDFTIPNVFSFSQLETDKKGNLFACDFQSGIIYVISLINNSYSVLATVNSPGGILFDGPKNRLLVTGTQDDKITGINLSTELVDFGIYTVFHNLRGLAKDNCGNIYVASMQGNSVYAYDSDFKYPPTMLVGSLNSPLGLCINPKNQKLVIANFQSHSISTIDLHQGCYTLKKSMPLNNSVSNGRVITFYWQDAIPFAKSASSYEVEYSTDSTFNESVMKLYTNNLNSEPVTLNYNTSYFWRVRTIGGSGKDIFGDVWHFTTGSSAGIYDDIIDVRTLKPYPVPSFQSVFLNIKINDAQIEIYDLQGKQVNVSRLSNQNTDSGIDISGLANGIYMMKVSTQEGKIYLSKFEVVK